MMDLCIELNKFEAGVWSAPKLKANNSVKKLLAHGFDREFLGLDQKGKSATAKVKDDPEVQARPRRCFQH